MPTRFADHLARERVERLWQLPSHFGFERNSNHIYLTELISDRYQLVSGMQLLRDELQLARGRTSTDVTACAADLSVPSVLTTMAFTTCGDRIHQGEADHFRRIVANRFATISEVGDLKLESFSPAGGGTDDGATLAHVTVSHHIDDQVRAVLYDGNPASYVLVGLDLMTHVGRLESQPNADGSAGLPSFGTTRESPWREPRAACGALRGALYQYNRESRVHRRVLNDLGDDNFAFLRDRGVRSTEGVDVTMVVAASIVAVRGIHNVAQALTHELDARGVGHLSASITVNRTSADDTLIYCARATVFGGEIRVQGLGLDATQYTARIVAHAGDGRLALTYGGADPAQMPVASSRYEVAGTPASDRFEDM